MFNKRSSDPVEVISRYVSAPRRHTQYLFWGFLVAALAVFAGLSIPTEVDDGPYVARVELFGIIFGDTERSDVLRELADDSDVAAVLLVLDSPGGTVYGGEQLLKDLEFIRAEKPVIAVMESVAASGAYMASLGADYVFAGETTITGSVGVIMQSTEVTGLLEKVGVESTVIKSGGKKAIPNPFEKLDESGLAYLQDDIDDLFDWFLDLVVTRRGLTDDVVDLIRDGRVVSGARAAELGLIDAIGGIPEAREWLEANEQIETDLDEYTAWPLWEPPSLLEEFLSDYFGKSYISEVLKLDGALALWHPASK